MSQTPQTNTCLVCGGATTVCLDLGRQPLANALLATSDEPYETFPLGLAMCATCSHGQLTHFVPPDRLFRNYLYASGTGGALQSFFTWFAQSLAKALPARGRVLEIACNDGSLLDCFKAEGIDACGVDPAANLTAVARGKGHAVHTGFFPDTRPDGRFDAIVAMNVTAHTPAPRALMQGVKECLAPNGAAFIQTSQAFMLVNGEFDTIYHEHYSFFSPASMKRLAQESGLRLEARRLVSVHGRSLLCILRHADAPDVPIAFDNTPPFGVEWPSPEPAIMALDIDADTARASYRAFAEHAHSAMDGARRRVCEHRGRGATIALAGVAAKAMTFLNAAEIVPDAYLDEAQLKFGRYVPGSKKAIEPLSSAAALPDDTLFVIGAWNFAGPIADKIRALRPGRPSTFLVYFPQIKEFT